MGEEDRRCSLTFNWFAIVSDVKVVKPNFRWLILNGNTAIPVVDNLWQVCAPSRRYDLSFKFITDKNQLLLEQGSCLLMVIGQYDTCGQVEHWSSWYDEIDGVEHVDLRLSDGADSVHVIRLR